MFSSSNGLFLCLLGAADARTADGAGGGVRASGRGRSGALAVDQRGRRRRPAGPVQSDPTEGGSHLAPLLSIPSKRLMRLAGPGRRDFPGV